MRDVRERLIHAAQSSPPILAFAELILCGSLTHKTLGHHVIHNVVVSETVRRTHP